VAKLELCSVTPDDLGRLVALEPSGAAGEAWTRPSEPVDERTQILLDDLTAKLAEAHPTTLNEATLWSRALYPLLELAETGLVRAWAEVALTAKDPFSDAELTGVVDGVLAPESVFAGTPGQPFLLVMEAKRTGGCTDPRPALLAALVAVLWNKLGPAEAGARTEAFGCFTAGDIWTFVRAEATVRPEDRTPRLGVMPSAPRPPPSSRSCAGSPAGPGGERAAPNPVAAEARGARCPTFKGCARCVRVAPGTAP
jgi:hypothetical protein